MKTCVMLAPSVASWKHTVGEGQVSVAPGAQPVFSYRVRTEEGSAAWSDDSGRQPPVLFKLAKLTRDVAKGPCHLAR